MPGDTAAMDLVHLWAPALSDMNAPTLSYWLERFVLEARKANGEEYQPNSLHHIVCGVMRYLRLNVKDSIDFFKDPEFASFRPVGHGCRNEAVAS